jgi:hypothetical protein
VLPLADLTSPQPGEERAFVAAAQVENLPLLKGKEIRRKRGFRRIDGYRDLIG